MTIQPGIILGTVFLIACNVLEDKSDIIRLLGHEFIIYSFVLGIATEERTGPEAGKGLGCKSL